MQEQVKPTLAIAGILGFIAVLTGLLYLRSLGVGAPSAGAPPGLSQMKQSNLGGSASAPPAPAAYVPPGAPPGVRQMIGQNRFGNPSAAPAPASYVPPGAPTGVRLMIQKNPPGSASGMPGSRP
jgi:hypothetical protein